MNLQRFQPFAFPSGGVLCLFLVFPILTKIDRALETKQRCRLIDKMGKYLNGTVTDSWTRLSGGKVRGKVVFQSDEKGTVEIDANDILDIILE